MDPSFEKVPEIYFRLAIICKHLGKVQRALDLLRAILNHPPEPLTSADILLQIGVIYERTKSFSLAKGVYEHALTLDPQHSGVLQQLCWFHHVCPLYRSSNLSLKYLQQSLEVDASDGQSWYLIGRCWMAENQYKKAYQAYQQAVCREPRNATFWCSIGVLYFQINQYRDALDAYSRAVRINPDQAEVWYNLATLYESCRQYTDAADAYTKAAEIEPTHPLIRYRLRVLHELVQSEKNKGVAGEVAQSFRPRKVSARTRSAGNAKPSPAARKDAAMANPTNPRNLTNDHDHKHDVFEMAMGDQSMHGLDILAEAVPVTETARNSVGRKSEERTQGEQASMMADAFGLNMIIGAAAGKQGTTGDSSGPSDPADPQA